jgi:hypothetical protein
MAISKKLFAPTVMLFLGLLVLNPAPGRIFASKDDTLSQLQKDDWHEYFSNGGKEKLNRSFDALLELANNTGLDWHIRIRGIILLSETSDPRKADVLLGMFLNPLFNWECPAVKTCIVTAFGSVDKDQRIVDALIDGMNDREVQVREAAVQVLGRIGDEKAVPFLIKKLDDRSVAIRLSAIRSLGQIKDQRAVPFLKKIADGDQEDLIRNEAASALTRMKS